MKKSRKHLHVNGPRHGGIVFECTLRAVRTALLAACRLHELCNAPPVAQAVGLAAAIKYLDSIGREAIRQHEKQLTQYASSKLSEMKHVKIYGNAPDKGPIISFNLNDAHAHDVATIIDHYGIAVRAGAHCAMPLMSMLGASSTCRASFGLYNTFEEIDDFVEGLAKAQSLFS